MENLKEEKNGKGLIVLVVVLALLLGFSVGYICYDKFLSDEEMSKNGDSDSSNGVISEQQEPNGQLIKDLHASLVSVDNSYGLYFSKSVDINNITAEQFLPLVLTNYIKENNISTKADLQCVLHDDYSEYCDEFVSVSKSQIDSYIKTKYNTERDFTLKANYDSSHYSKQMAISDFVYDLDNQKYYFGRIPATGYGSEVYNKIINSEQNGDYVYIYDTAFMCEFVNGIYCYANMHTENDKVIFSYAMGMEKPDFVIIDSKNNSSIDYDYVFNNYQNKLNKYKHTFKLENDGNYYWISSELVK